MVEYFDAISLMPKLRLDYIMGRMGKFLIILTT
jgi:hypothetical protein